jgi:hypothetical protein
MLGINPQIFEHKIMTYPNAKPFQQKIHPSQSLKSKLQSRQEVEKLLKLGFVYPVQLTKWVSNPVPVNKKHGHDSMFVWISVI